MDGLGVRLDEVEDELVAPAPGPVRLLVLTELSSAQLVSVRLAAMLVISSQDSTQAMIVQTQFLCFFPRCVYGHRC